MVRVGWIFSLVRSGSSAASYALASPWHLPVADEILGPWDRTEEPHSMPAAQAELVRAFEGTGHTLTEDVANLAHSVLRELAERDPSGDNRVVCKCPHLMFSPEDFEKWFASAAGFDHQAIYLIRNPLRRLNSCYARGWEQFLNDPYELEIYRTFAQRWSNAKTRVRFDDMLQGPDEFFRSIYSAWGWDADEDEIRAACDYLAAHYHDSSGEHRKKADESAPLSESTWRTPRAAIDAYLSDEELRTFMADQGWATSPRAYEGGVLMRFRRAYKGVCA